MLTSLKSIGIDSRSFVPRSNCFFHKNPMKNADRDNVTVTPSLSYSN